MLPLLVVGLGNPGKKYAKTRHNLGFLAVERLAELLGWTFSHQDRYLGRVAKGIIKGEGAERTVWLLLPETFMNRSGEAVRALAHYHKILAPEIVAVQDDVALPYGQMRLRLKGSPGGHNGLKSIEAYLNTPNYMRLKLGVGDDLTRDLADHVLAPFTEEEGKILPEFIEQAAAALMQLLTKDVHLVMTVVNAKKGN